MKEKEYKNEKSRQNEKSYASHIAIQHTCSNADFSRGMSFMANRSTRIWTSGGNSPGENIRNKRNILHDFVL